MLEVTTAKLNVEMIGISTTEEVASKVLEAGSTVTSTELDVEVTTTASEVEGTLELGTMVMSSKLEVGAGTSISDVTAVVAAMLDKALASEEAAEAASPDVTTVAALLKMDCRLEI